MPGRAAASSRPVSEPTPSATRPLELIVLNIGLDLRIISPTLFAMMVIMAVLTTIATTPILHLLTRGYATDAARAPEPAAPGHRS
jgi:Kef-type K+ transport system membrane component KefB